MPDTNLILHVKGTDADTTVLPRNAVRAGVSEGTISHSQLIWIPGENKWKQVKELPELLEGERLILHVKGTEGETQELPKQEVKTAVSQGKITHSQLIWIPSQNTWKPVRELPDLLPGETLILHVKGTEAETKELPRKAVQTAVSQGQITHSQLIWIPNEQTWKPVRELPDLLPGERLILHVKGTEAETKELPRKAIKTALSKGEITHSQLIWSPNEHAWKQVREIPELLPSQKLAPAPSRETLHATPRIVDGIIPESPSGPVARAVAVSADLPQVRVAVAQPVPMAVAVHVSADVPQVRIASEAVVVPKVVEQVSTPHVRVAGSPPKVIPKVAAAVPRVRVVEEAPEAEEPEGLPHAEVAAQVPRVRVAVAQPVPMAAAVPVAAESPPVRVAVAQPVPMAVAVPVAAEVPPVRVAVAQPVPMAVAVPVAAEVPPVRVAVAQPVPMAVAVPVAAEIPQVRVAVAQPVPRAVAIPDAEEIPPVRVAVAQPVPTAVSVPVAAEVPQVRVAVAQTVPTAVTVPVAASVAPQARVMAAAQPTPQAAPVQTADPAKSPTKPAKAADHRVKVDSGPHPLKWLCIGMGVLIVLVLMINYFLVDQPLVSNMSQTHYSNVTVYAHLGAYVQPNVMVIHVPPSTQLTPATFTDFLVQLAHSTPNDPLTGEPFGRIALTYGWKAEYSFSGYSWDELGQLVNSTDEQRKEEIMSRMGDATGQPILPESTLDPDAQRAQRDIIWAAFMNHFAVGQ